VRRVGLVLALAVFALGAGCGSHPDEPFDEIAAAAGLSFKHAAGERGEYLLPEIIGAGAALIDYDGDGDLDVFLVQGGALAGAATASDAAEPAAAVHTLFRNELVPSGALRFTDVTSAAGLADVGYGMGAATADIDGDGDGDLLVTEVGRNRLYRNDGGRFTEIAQEAGVADGGWGTSASFCDYDRDGDADLYVAHYVRFDPAQNKVCTGTTGHRDYCSPEAYPPEPDRLFRNDGNGRFSDVSADSGIGMLAAGAGLGVVCADFDGDQLPDFYVANDRTANFYWHNAGGGRFEEQGVVRGAAYDGAGKAEASMGIAVDDFDGDGVEDLFVTTYDPETNTLRENDGKGYFLDVTDRLGLGLPSLSYTGWGTGWVDVDDDGVAELFVANGAILEVESQRGRSPRPYEQRNQLFRRTDDGRFAVEPPRGALGLVENSRGAAFGDVDNDGDVDVLVTNNDGPVRLLASRARGHWLGVQLAGAGAAATGARVTVKRAGGAPLARRVHTDGSYLSASDPRLQFGLGAKSSVDEVLVEWPDGRSERWRGLAADRYHVLREGEGEAPL
jgi:hypothetical protein